MNLTQPCCHRFSLAVCCAVFCATVSWSTIAFADEFEPNRKVTYKSVSQTELKLHVFEPSDHQESDKAPAIVFFFGGGWNGGSATQFYEQARYLADRGVVSISADYRTKKSHKTSPFECVADAKSAIRWVRTHAKELGVDPNRIVAAGGSAGGHLAACTGVIDQHDEENENVAISSVPNAMILFNPVLDTTAKGYGLKQVGKRRQTEISPCHHVRAGIVPTLVFHGTADTTVPFENAQRFTRLMKEAGNKCQLESFAGMGHGFFNGSHFRKKNKDTSPFKRTMQQSVDFLISLGFLDAGANESAFLALVVKSLQQSDDDTTRCSIMTGMLKGLEGRRRVHTPQGWSEVSHSLLQNSNQKVRDLAMELSQIFGDVAATEKALLILKDESAETVSRRNALRTLLAQQNEEASDSLESLLDDPDLTLDAIRGYAVVENATAPGVLLSRYDKMNTDQQRAVIETLATRKYYAAELIEAVKSKRIAREKIPVHVARSLREILSGSFNEVFGELKPIGDDREKLLAKYKALLTQEALENANASRGRAIYQKTCANCHLLYDEGGDIGPELTGSNRANLDYILLNSVDPSYDVPEGYRTVSVATEDGRLIMGVVAEEDATKLVLKTVEQPRLAIAKEDIEARKISKKSMMPDGQLEQMKPQEVIDLIKYLQTTEQVEVAK